MDCHFMFPLVLREAGFVYTYKTFTMEGVIGVSDKQDIIPPIVNYIFNHIQGKVDFKFEVLLEVKRWAVLGALRKCLTGPSMVYLTCINKPLPVLGNVISDLADALLHSLNWKLSPPWILARLNELLQYLIVEINHSQDHKENVRVNEELSVLDYKKLFEKERVEALKRKVENLELELSRWRSGEITDEQFVEKLKDQMMEHEELIASTRRDYELLQQGMNRIQQENDVHGTDATYIFAYLQDLARPSSFNQLGESGCKSLWCEQQSEHLLELIATSM
ncbi:hypothetical protein ONE63_001114 [Megalurothrips usitatus]|uniref:Kinetochore protein NDC80 homolog n=1 Tax=Megalurothrips usitatus TaxID=439358 RepID=A0AAV7XC40_9NEOP|nr:hypothetical protein ONE63_001114 [Megalurothrips usitatus]